LRRHIAIAISTITIVLSSVVPDGSPIDAYGLAQANQGLEFYVSPYGKDTNPGTLLRPFQTLAHAQAVVRSIDGDMTGNITVNLENGSFRQRQPLVFGPSDSGTNGYDVVWRSAPGATPTISGARRIMGWKLSDPAKNIWAAPVPAGLMTRQIYVNGVRAWLAFGPPPGKLHRIWLGYETSTPVMAHWRNPSDIDFVYSSQLGDAVEPICPVGSVSGDVITMAQPCWYNSNLRRKNVVGFGILSTPTYIENAYELLDQPGEFYLDPRLHMLYYIPRAREDMHTADVEVPALQTLIAGFGSAGRPIHNITFSGL
jgi:hypothetical protein